MALRNGEITENDLPFELSQEISNEFIKAINIGFKYNQPDKEMMWMLENSIYSFSGAKSMHELQLLNSALKKDKALTSLSDFKKAAVKINEEYNINYLKTEYNSAIAAAQTGARWWEYRKNEDIMPYLQYQTAGDGRVRESHQLLNGIVKHIRDIFWTTHYPPNGWNCRCEAIQLPNTDNVEITEDTPKVDIPALFKTNLAHSGVVFPDNSAYYKAIDNKDLLWMRPSFQKAVEPIEKLKKLYPKFTHIELACFYNYTDHDFMYLNPLMKDKISNRFIEAYKEILNRALDKCETYNKTVYRGITISENELATYVKGKILEWNAFTSSSLDKDTAMLYLKNKKGTKILFQIESKNGKLIDPISAKGKNFTEHAELEVMFKTKSKFKVIEEQEVLKDGIYLITLTEID